MAVRHIDRAHESNLAIDDRNFAVIAAVQTAKDKGSFRFSFGSNKPEVDHQPAPKLGRQKRVINADLDFGFLKLDSAGLPPSAGTNSIDEKPHANTAARCFSKFLNNFVTDLIIVENVNFKVDGTRRASPLGKEALEV